MIGSVGPLTSSFLLNTLGRFREERPLVEVTVLHLNNRLQVEALLDGSIMLGIRYFGSAADEDEREQLSTRLLLRSPVGIACSNIADFQKVRRQSLETFVTKNSNLSTRSTDMGTRIGSEDFVGGLVGLSPRSER